jgi:hypothetical protein
VADAEVVTGDVAATAVVEIPEKVRARQYPVWVIGRHRPQWRPDDMRPSTPDPDWPRTAWWW